MKTILMITLTAFVFLGCESQGQKEITEDEKKELLILGETIAMDAQKTLVQNVAAAIQKGGAEYAVEFCNTNAMQLTDSISNLHKKLIQRLSDKNRNPDNDLKTEIDYSVWDKFQKDKSELVLQDKEGDIYFYKPIVIGVESCIQCHGKKSVISEGTLSMIQEKYPKDKAIGYEMGDLRGMWKIKL